MTYKIIFVNLNFDNFFTLLEPTKLHVGIHTLTSDHFVKFVLVVTSLHVQRFFYLLPDIQSMQLEMY